MQYWRTLPYIGFGAGAHGFVNGYRLANVLAPAAYIQRFKEAGMSSFPRSSATASIEKIDVRRAMGEMMMMGLRLTKEGVTASHFSERFGQDLHAVYSQQIGRMQGLGLLESLNGDQNAIRLTKRGRLLGNQVFVEFI
jgi:oxygen-independent coproporphyrinogen-3 oxidase